MASSKTSTKKSAPKKAEAPKVEAPDPPVAPPEKVEVVGVTPQKGTDKPIEVEPLGSGSLQIRTNGWVVLDETAQARFEKALRRARQS